MTAPVTAFVSEEKPYRGRLPVTLITGFLGSGKTTLLNHILTNQHGLRIAVMVNEVGEIGIDSELIVSADRDMLELSNGCICCSVNNDLVDGIFRVLEREDVDYLVIETTGLADPLPIILTLLRSEFRDQLRLDSIITLVDGENFSPDLFDSQAAYNQLRYADIILLNKCDLAASERLHALEEQIREVRAAGRIIHTVRSSVPLHLIMSVRSFDADLDFVDAADVAEGRHEDGHLHSTTHGFGSVSFASDQPFALDKFQYFLEQQLPDDVFRGKGILWIDNSDKRYIFQLVGKRFSIDETEWVGPKKNRLVLIGRNLDGEGLRLHLEACLALSSDGPAQASQATEVA